MPSSTPKQARVMSAIAHGWHPTGSAANIPVSVAKEFHASDAGKPYGGKHKGTAGPKVADKYKRQYHREAGTPYHAHGGGVTGGVMGDGGAHRGESTVYRGHGGGISMGKARPMPFHEPPEVTAWPMERRKSPHMRDAVERDWGHQGGYRANDPDHPQLEPHHQRHDGTGFVRHVATTSYPTSVSTHRHMQGTAGGHQIGASSSGRGAHTFRGARGRFGK